VRGSRPPTGTQVIITQSVQGLVDMNQVPVHPTGKLVDRLTVIYTCFVYRTESSGERKERPAKAGRASAPASCGSVLYAGSSCLWFRSHQNQKNASCSE
jgi:hypothetical protein